MRAPILLAALALTLTAAQPGAQGSDGQLAFNNACRTCHTVKEGDNRLGPHLFNIIGRKAGSAAGYTNYSPAMTGAGVVWDEATLDRFIENPDAVIPGNNMKPYTGMTSAEDRKNIVDYLKQQKSGG